MEGYFYGVLDVYYAKITTPATATAKPVYAEPKVLAKAIETTLTPTYREGKLYASNATLRNKRKVDTYGVKLNLDKITHEVLKEILNREADSNGVQIIKGDGEPADVAIGFAYTLDDGSKELWWLLQGQFQEPVKAGKTDGEKIEYQTPNLEGTFTRRMNDGRLAAVVDTTTVDVPQAVISGWFSAVYESPEGP